MTAMITMETPKAIMAHSILLVADLLSRKRLSVSMVTPLQFLGLVETPRE
jgi:hypothetical protein